jgi:hypothetical protein
VNRELLAVNRVEGMRQGRKKSHPRRRSWAIAAIVAAMALAWGIHSSPFALSYFQVDEIQVQGNVHVATVELLSRLKLRPPVDVLRVNLEELVGRITTHPWISRASIHRRLPHGLLVTVEERRPVARLSMGKTYLLSADAVILEEVPRPPTPALPLLRTTWRAEYRPGERLGDPRILGGLALLETLEEAPLLRETRVEAVTAEADGNYVLHLEGSRATLRLEPAEPLRQLHRLDVALQHRGQALGSFAYADLRFPGRVILKPHEKGG